MQGVPPLSSFPLSNISCDNNQHFARGYPTELFSPFYLYFDSNQNFARGYPTELSLNFFLVNVVSVMLTEGNNQNFARGSPTELFSFFLFLITTGILQGVCSTTELSFFKFSLVKVGSFPLTEGNNRNFARGSPTELYFFNFIWSTWYQFR